ncbi:MAG: OmpH family outer membrane protein [Alphaproteobacteria bacterium]|nr:OmpH family outer membrane protein [Alphaproteobacteria bacterium]MBU1526949.1 OmpH family outer membrane protein [Alphaproteobacteria bacterium]MBU2118486.1 OmpH family outer membrane protein [Alphaproteobacteria bacterium]MBU2350966.1 OmpH family outer membrane protein [Alphaproteobacteria bacterium]MBU2383844.1 OmpH family outer membrane protein [Alphaproteobacteria bacterium]
MKTLASGAFALTLLFAGQAAAQSQGPANPGPVIPGVCVFHNERLLAQSTVGRSVQTGMRTLSDQVSGELQPYAQSIQAEITALEQGRGTIPEQEFAQRSQALQQRIREAQQLEAQRQQELEYTLNMQLRAIAQATDPILVAVYQERGCGLLLSREAVIEMNPAMDITDVVIQRLNGALPSLTFSRMTPPVQVPNQ